MKSDLTIHMIVKNEEQWVWYAINSVLKFIDQIIVYDTGSSDNTINIIKTIKTGKLIFSELGNLTARELVILRNDQVYKTGTSWFMLLDGDEVWSQAGIQEVLRRIKTTRLHISAFISKTLVPVGDLFHYQSDNAGKYVIKKRQGHFNLRIYKKMEGYHWEGTYPLEAYVNRRGKPIQSEEDKLEFLDEPYWHLTHLKRSSIDTHMKRKLEVGGYKKIYLPEVFFYTRPCTIPSPWISFDNKELLLAQFLTPLIKVKRKLVT